MKKVAIILSGCGHQDGAEIQESVATLLALNKAHAEVTGFAPDRNQYHVLNHLTQQEQAESRNIMVEAARIMRGNVKPLSALKVADFDAIFFPGGSGAAKNFFDLATKGENYRVFDDIALVVKDIVHHKKPAGFICIMPMVIPHFYPQGTEMTIGNDHKLAAMIEKHGLKHINCKATDCVIDRKHQLVTTPAYMLAKEISEVFTGVEKLVNAVLAMT